MDEYYSWYTDDYYFVDNEFYGFGCGDHGYYSGNGIGDNYLGKSKGNGRSIITTLIFAKENNGCGDGDSDYFDEFMR